MNTQTLLTLLDRLGAGIDPTTGTPFDVPTSCINQPDIAAGLSRFRGVVQHQRDAVAEELPDAVLDRTTRELKELGYRPTPEQIVKVLRASRSIADRTLKAVTDYGAYRNKFSERYLQSAAESFASRHPDLFSNQAPVKKKRGKKEKPDYLQNPFFRENHFDKLSTEKAEELKAEITHLGFARPTEKLPEFKRRARVNYPRAYEPWGRAEHALLIEAMCYTNDAEKIAALFGRTAKSITDAGLKLIYQSQRGTAA